MSKVTDKLREKKIVNDYDFFGDEPFAYYQVNDRISGQTSAWMVRKRGEKLSDIWYDHGCKSFLVWGRKDKADKFNEACVYLYSQFGVEKVARSPFGGWGDAEFVARRLKELLG